MRLSPRRLTEMLVLSLEQAGCSVVVQTDPADRPLLLRVQSLDQVWDLRVFLWNITLGGPAGVRDPLEWRVQTTRPRTVPFDVDDGRYTILLGYHEATGAIAAWEVRAHPNPGASSSLQVSLSTLERARDEGFASQARDLGAGGHEVVVAFPPSLLSTYLEILPDLRAAIVDASDATSGQVATEGHDPAPEDLPAENERRIAIRQIAQRVRDARFRWRVLTAYGGRCAFCDLDLGLAEAAHINPVAHGGPDQIVNGVAACPTHHRALDRGLLVVDDDLTIAVNADRAAALGFSSQDLGALAAGLRPSLRDTGQADQRPALEHLRAQRQRWS
jgi:putative restriction endonuclease